jgi:hypothetical protein
MNLRALATADPDIPQRQRNCGVVPVGDRVEIRMNDGSAYYCGLETCGNVWLCPVCSAKIHLAPARVARRADELRGALSAWEAKGHAASLVTADGVQLVMRLNKQDGGRRRCILVTNNEVSVRE